MCRTRELWWRRRWRFQAGPWRRRGSDDDRSAASAGPTGPGGGIRRSVSDSNPAPGASFTLSVTVSNTGGAASPSTTLRYYRSPDATITPSDTSVDTAAVGALAATGTSSLTVSLTAPSNLGTYYYGACVDAVAGESGTTNNCSSSVTVTVRQPVQGVRGPVQEVLDPAPDLVVDLPTVSDGSPAAGTSFTLSATVSNTGDGESLSTTLRYYRSPDATITPSDTSVGTDTVGALAAAGTSRQSVLLTAAVEPQNRTTTAPAWTRWTGESDPTNNCSLSVRVRVSVSEPVLEPNLVVGSPAVTDRSPMVRNGLHLVGDGEQHGRWGVAVATTLRFYRSTDAIDHDGPTRRWGRLLRWRGWPRAGSNSKSVGHGDRAGEPREPATTAPAWTTVTGESDTTDNCSSSVRVSAGVGPDLVVPRFLVLYHDPASGFEVHPDG